MTCRDLVDFLADYLDGSLPADVRAHFDRHLKACPPCIAFLNTYDSGSKLVQAAFEDECCQVPEELVQAIVAARKSTATTGHGS